MALKARHSLGKGKLPSNPAAMRAFAEDMIDEIFRMSFTHAIGVSGLNTPAAVKAAGDYLANSTARTKQQFATKAMGRLQFIAFKDEFKERVPGLRGRLFLHLFKKNLVRTTPKFNRAIIDN